MGGHVEETIALLPPSSADRSPIRTWRKSVSAPMDLHLDDDDSGSSRRSINFISLGFIAYFAVAAGPFGIEVAVQSAGAFPVLIAVVLLPFTWGMPQALMTAELSTMMDENGGYILWVRRGLGEFAGWINAFNAIASNICDLPTYPVLFNSYITAYLATQGYIVSPFESWCIKGASVLFVVLSNVLGIRAIALSSIAMSLFVLAPFVLEPFVATSITTDVWYQSAPDIHWSVFLSALVWNYQGWDSLGCIAGEVHDGGRAYPLAIAIALVLITINYALPVFVGVAIEPDFSLWKEGLLETIASKISSWLGIWVGAAAVIATLGEFNVVMACSSRALWATTKYKMLPNFLSYEWARYKTPVAAILFQAATTCCLMSFDFADLVVIDTFFNNLTMLLEFASYIRLKYIEPDTRRDFVVPGGLKGAWLITLPKLLVITGVLLVQDVSIWKAGLAFNLVISLIYIVWSKYHRRSKFSLSLPPGDR